MLTAQMFVAILGSACSLALLFGSIPREVPEETSTLDFVLACASGGLWGIELLLILLSSTT